MRSRGRVRKLEAGAGVGSSRSHLTVGRVLARLREPERGELDDLLTRSLNQDGEVDPDRLSPMDRLRTGQLLYQAGDRDLRALIRDREPLFANWLRMRHGE